MARRYERFTLSWVASTLGGVLSVYLLLRILMFGCRKLRQEAIDSFEIVWLSILTFAFVTVVGGYGMKNGALNPSLLKPWQRTLAGDGGCSR